jgi:predicted nucleic acid-binding protein
LSVAYVDSSCLVAIFLGEPGFRDVMLRLSRYDRLLSSSLLEAEVRATLAREGIPGNPGSLFAWITWVHPQRRLTREYRQILEIKPLRGADLWHLACALFMREKLQGLGFLTLDGGQAEAAKALGFQGL